MRSTVAIPLHQAGRWVDVISDNIESLHGIAHVMVSDPFEADDALAELRAIYAREKHVTFLGRRDLAPGWVAHCNDVQRRARTEFFMWLPQDDTIDEQWVLQGQEAMDLHPQALAACGTLHWMVEAAGDDGEYVRGQDVPMLEEWSATDTVTRLATAFAVAGSPNASSLGLLFRSLQRSASAVPLPPGVNGAWADVLWAISLLASSPVAGISATYLKRGHGQATHASWPALPLIPDVRASHFSYAAERADAMTVAKALAAAWDRDAAERSGHEAQLVSEVDRLRSELEVAQTEIAVMEQSRSWKLTLPLRTVASWARRVSSRPAA